MFKNFFFVLLAVMISACATVKNDSPLPTSDSSVKSYNCENCGCPGPTCVETPEPGCLDGDQVKCKDCGSTKAFLPSGSPPHVAHEDDMKKKMNKKYPPWYRGCAPDGLAGNCSNHFYYTMIGPGLEAPGYNAENVYCGTFYMKPGKTYPSHNHPAREFYYIIDGEAKWHAGGKEFDAKQGTFIVHEPYTPHGWTNTSETTWLRAFYCWWKEPGDSEDVLNIGGRLTNPCISQSPETAKPFKVPLPECKKE